MASRPGRLRQPASGVAVLARLRLVERIAESHQGGVQIFHAVPRPDGVVIVDRGSQLARRLVDGFDQILRDQAARIGGDPHGGINLLVRLVLDFLLLAPLFVRFAVLLGLMDHALDFVGPRPLEAVIVTFCMLPVAMSLAETWTMPFWSMSKVTSTARQPRGAAECR